MLKSIRIKIFTSIKFSFSVTLVESDERHQNDICDGITAHGNNIITPEFLPRVPQEQESQEMNEINKETRTADQQITRMDQETNRTDQTATRIEEECAMTIQERNRIELESIGTEMTRMGQEQNMEAITQSHIEMEVESEPAIQMDSR